MAGGGLAHRGSRGAAGPDGRYVLGGAAGPGLGGARRPGRADPRPPGRSGGRCRPDGLPAAEPGGGSRLHGPLPQVHRGRAAPDQVGRLCGRPDRGGAAGVRDRVRQPAGRLSGGRAAHPDRSRDRDHEVPAVRDRRRHQQDDCLRLAGRVHHGRLRPGRRRDRLARAGRPAGRLAARPGPVHPGHRGGGGGLPAGQGTGAAPGQPAGVRPPGHSLRGAQRVRQPDGRGLRGAGCAAPDGLGAGPRHGGRPRGGVAEGRGGVPGRRLLARGRRAGAAGGPG
jgi:hypothetical protein